MSIEPGSLVPDWHKVTNSKGYLFIQFQITFRNTFAIAI